MNYINNMTIIKELNNCLHQEKTPREIEIEKILKEEKDQYEKDKKEFYSNPLHWSNNKRKYAGLPVLRGKINKHRIKKFRSFHPIPRIFFLIEDTIDEMISAQIQKPEFFNSFVEIKNFKKGKNYE